jgi:hypothetical protein
MLRHDGVKIRHPVALLDKLGVKAGSRVALIGVLDAEFHRLLDERAVLLVEDGDDNPIDLVLLAVNRRGDLEQIGGLERRIARSGAVWVVYPKGRQEIREQDVLAAGRDAGFKDTKIASFSATHTALKFVIPLARR